MISIATKQIHSDAELVTRAVTNAADSLGLSSTELARVIGASEATVSRMRRGQTSLKQQHKHWELALLLIRLYRSLDAICAGDAETARAWLRHYNHDLNATPVELICGIEGLTMTLTYVDNSRAVA